MRDENYVPSQSITLSGSGTGQPVREPAVQFRNRKRLVYTEMKECEACEAEERCCTRFQPYLEKMYPDSTSRSCSGVKRSSFMNRIVLHFKGKVDEDKKFRW